MKIVKTMLGIIIAVSSGLAAFMVARVPEAYHLSSTSHYLAGIAAGLLIIAGSLIAHYVITL
jgi:hypothetical protein